MKSVFVRGDRGGVKGYEVNLPKHVPHESSIIYHLKVKTEKPTQTVRKSLSPHTQNRAEISVVLQLCFLSCLYLTPEEGLSTGATVLIVYEFEEEKVEECYERCHAEPKEEGQTWVSVGHVLLVGQDSFEVQCVLEVLQVAQVCGDVQQWCDWLGHHHREDVTFDLRCKFHRFIEAASLAGIQLHWLLLRFHCHMKKRLPLYVQQHCQVNQILVIVDPSQGIAVVQNIWISLELKVVLSELKASKAEHHALHSSMGPSCH